MKTKLALLAVVILNFARPDCPADENAAAATPPVESTSTAPAAPAPVELAAAETSPASTNAVAETRPVEKAAAKLPVTADAGASTNAAMEIAMINMPEAPLTDVISTLARQAGINFQFDPRVTGGVGPDGKPLPLPNVSIRWENVTAMQALEALLANHSLTLIQDPRTKIARVTIKDPAAPEPLVTRVIQLKYASPTNMAAVVQPTLGTRSKVLPDSRTSRLIVLATEKEMEGVDTLLNQLDVAPRQVLIEARLLETARSPSSIKGIDWSGTLQAQNVSFGNGRTTGNTTQVSPGTPTTTTTTLPSGRTISTTVASPGTSATSLSTLLGNGGLSLNTARGLNPATAFLNADGMNAVLSFLNKDADTTVVSLPRTVTLDNERARLEVTRAFPIFKTTPGTSQTPAGSEITYTNLGTILTVTPRISANSNIALKVVPEVSNIDSKDRQVQNGQEQTANVYAIRRIETQVIIPSGHTLVMGGLISDSSSKSQTKVPVLGDLPGIGLAFRSDSKVRNKSNLLVFITPTIVGDNDFQETANVFLKTKVPEYKDKEESPWDTGKPYDWNWKRE
ncbi:MAG: hypothetical protein HY043_08815 [Verrucomicrobia bacterium]|nr:hypothetical protein [Verrucomicrobiota bacterium]